MRRTVLLSIVLVLVLSLFYPASAKVIIRYATNHSPEDPSGYGANVVKPAIEKFNEEHSDIEVVMDVIPSGNFQDKVNMELAAGVGPDIWDAEIGWTLDYFRRSVVAAVPENLADQYRRDAMPGPIQTLEFDGKLWGAPPYTDCLALFYNVDMLNDAAVPVPETWEEFETAAIKLTERDPSGRLTQSGFTQWNAYEHVFWSFFYQNGGTFVDEDPVKMITSPEAIEAADFGFRQPYREWKVAALDFYDGWEGFLAGKVAMTINGNWYLPFLNSASEVNYEVAMLPRHKQFASTQGGWNILINAKAPKEVWEFVEYYTTDKEVNANRLRVNYLPAVRSGYEDADWAMLDHRLRPFYELLPYAQAMPFFRGFQEFKRTLNSAIETLITSDQSTEKVLGDVGNQMKRVLGR